MHTRSLRSLPAYRKGLCVSRAAASLRLSSTSAKPKPCTKYMEITHADGPLPESAAQPSSFLQLYARPPFVLSHGKGSWVFTTPQTLPVTADATHTSPFMTPPGETGRKYLDFTSGIAVNALGHGDPLFAQAMYDQTLKLSHTSNVFWNEWAGKLAGLLEELTRRDGGLGWKEGSEGAKGPGARVFFTSSGTEANEGAFKFARRIGKERWSLKETGQPWSLPAPQTHKSSASPVCPKYRFACFQNAFHGRSFGAISATPNPKYQAPFEPLVPGFDVGKLNDFEGLERLVGQDTCGVVVEVVQGEGGLGVAQVEWLRALRKRCDEVGAVLIFDEIQCGLYRTGTLWAHSKYPTDCHPDIITMAKPLANGYPIGAILMREKLASAIAVGSHGTTFGGSPLATRLGHHVLSRLSHPSFITHVREVASHLHQRLTVLAPMFPSTIQSQPRGRGLLTGLGFNDAEDPARVVKMMRERGVLILTAGKDAVRIVPSLVVKREEVDLACDVLESVLVGLEKEKSK